MKILAFDIERVPANSYHWDNWGVNIPVSMQIKPSSMVSFAARWEDQPKNSVIYRSVWDHGQTEMLNEISDLLSIADATLGYNQEGFDIKHVNTEFTTARPRIPAPPQIPHIDLYKVAKNRFKFQSNKLGYILEQMGLPGKLEHEGFGLWLKSMNGDLRAQRKFRRYNEQDVHAVIRLYREWISWIPNHPNHLLYTPGAGCPRCGGPDSDLVREGTRSTGVGTYQRYRCNNCNGWTRSGKSLNRVDLRGD